MNADGLIQTANLTKSYASGPTRVMALREVNLTVARGRFIGITGASGSGKSTLMNLLGGLDTPTSGSICVGGKRISELNSAQLALFRRDTVGMIFQSFNLVVSYSAIENVAFPLLFANVPKKERLERAAQLLQVVGLEDRRDYRPTELSGGEQQRVAVARALVNRPEILLADEPTGNLDSKTSLQIVQMLHDLKTEQSLTIVMISHEEQLLREFSDEVVTLQDGAVTSHEMLKGRP